MQRECKCTLIWASNRLWFLASVKPAAAAIVNYSGNPAFLNPNLAYVTLAGDTTFGRQRAAGILRCRVHQCDECRH